MKIFHQIEKALIVLRSAVDGKFFAIMLATTAFGDVSPNWSRQVVDTIDPGSGLVVVSTSSVGGRLSANCVYQPIVTSSPIVLHGMNDSDGRFWPFVTYELSTEGVKWQAIGKFSECENAATIQFDSTTPKRLLHVNMESFRPAIGKFRWARLVLPNGDAAAFALEDLLPTGDSRDSDGNFKQDITDLHPTRFGSSFSLVGITSLSGRLVGDFIFCGAPGTFTEIGGTVTPDGDFWPFTTLQVGDSDNNWKTIGKSKNEGRSISIKVSGRGPFKRLRVGLNSYKSALGRFRYGRIIFSGDDVAVFEMSDLKPKL